MGSGVLAQQSIPDSFGHLRGAPLFVECFVGSPETGWSTSKIFAHRFSAMLRLQQKLAQFSIPSLDVMLFSRFAFAPWSGQAGLSARSLLDRPRAEGYQSAFQWTHSLS